MLACTCENFKYCTSSSKAASYFATIRNYCLWFLLFCSLQLIFVNVSYIKYTCSESWCELILIHLRPPCWKGIQILCEANPKYNVQMKHHRGFMCACAICMVCVSLGGCSQKYTSNFQNIMRTGRSLMLLSILN